LLLTLLSPAALPAAAEQLASGLVQLSGYFERYKARLSPGNAAQLQQLRRLASAFEECLRPGSAAGQPAAAAAAAAAAGSGGSSSSGGSPAGHCQVLTCSRFLIELSLDSINLFPLLAWVRDSKVLFKVSGFAAAAEQAAGCVQLHQPGEGRGSLSSLHALVGFLQALTNTNADGRVIVEHQQPALGPGSAAAAPAAAAAAGQRATKGPAASSSTTTTRSRGQLRFVLLNAAGHFGQILSGARSVILASGTLAPVEALRAQLFPGLPVAAVRHFECGHVIDPGNLVALALGKGPSGAPLDFRCAPPWGAAWRCPGRRQPAVQPAEDLVQSAAPVRYLESPARSVGFAASRR
jgi:chromosome transmission fidelity protein 1